MPYKRRFPKYCDIFANLALQQNLNIKVATFLIGVQIDCQAQIEKISGIPHFSVYRWIFLLDNRTAIDL